MPKKATPKKTAVKKATTSKPNTPEVKTQKMSPVNHFEITFDNLDRVKKFYSSIFGWNYVDFPEMDYTVVRTTEVDKNQMPITAGAVNGGFTKKSPARSYPTLVITVQSVDEASSKIKPLGGELIGERLDIGNMGIYQMFKDSEGNILGLFENKAPTLD